MKRIIRQTSPDFNTYQSKSAYDHLLIKSINKENKMTTNIFARANSEWLSIANEKFNLRGNEVTMLRTLARLVDSNGACAVPVGELTEQFQNQYGLISYSGTTSVLRRLVKKGLLKITQQGCGLPNLYELQTQN